MMNRVLAERSGSEVRMHICYFAWVMFWQHFLQIVCSINQTPVSVGHTVERTVKKWLSGSRYVNIHKLLNKLAGGVINLLLCLLWKCRDKQIKHIYGDTHRLLCSNREIAECMRFIYPWGAIFTSTVSQTHFHFNISLSFIYNQTFSHSPGS